MSVAHSLSRAEMIDLQHEVYSAVMGGLADWITADNRHEVAAEVADAITALIRVGQTNTERLAVYARSRGIAATGARRATLAG